MRTPRWRQRLESALQAQAPNHPDARVSLTFEVIYGHAFKPLPKVRMAAQTAVGVEDFRALARSARVRSGRVP